jgi:hypothetical protein
VGTVRGVTEVPSYVINLDLDPQDRYNELIPHFNDTVWEFYTDYFLQYPGLRHLLLNISEVRGPENDEITGELEGFAAMTKLPFEFLKAMQMFEEIQTMMIPVVNFSDVRERRARFPNGYEDLDLFPASIGGSCTAIIATNAADGMVYQARNLDVSPVDIFNRVSDTPTLLDTHTYIQSHDIETSLVAISGYLQT